MLDVVNLLAFPSSSRGLSEYRSSLNASETPFASRHSTSNGNGRSSDSPPRKTLRLDGDVDHSVSRIRAKGKGKARVVDEGVEDISTSVRKLRVVNPPENDITDQHIRAMKTDILECIVFVLNWQTNTEVEGEPPHTYESVYQATRTIVVVDGSGQWILDKLQAEMYKTAWGISKWLTSYQSSPANWLGELVRATAWFDTRVKLLESILLYLDRVYLLNKQDKPSIRKLAMTLFSTHIFQSVDIVSKLKDGIREWTTWERNARTEHAQRPSVKSLCMTLYDYSLFTPLFLSPFLDDTRSFYNAESQRLSEPDALQAHPGEFLIHCDGRIKEEKDRAKDVLEAYDWCWGDIEKATEESLLHGRLKWLCGGLEGAVRAKDTEGLERMYSLFKRVDGLKLLCEEFKNKVEKIVSEIVTDTERDEEMIDRLLDFKGFIDAALPVAFANPVAIPSAASGSTDTADQVKQTTNREFINAASDAFTYGFRRRKNKPAEMIAKFLDRAMRKGQQSATDEDFDKLLDSVLGLYRFTQDKDVFRAFYHRALSRRLLTQRSASDDFEKAVLKKLQEHYDPEFSMGDNMFRDLSLSRDIMTEFHCKPVGAGSAQNMTVMVLQRSVWPFNSRQKGDIALPPSMQSDLSKYTEFYKNAHKGHKLDFDHSLGTAQMRAQFLEGSKELSLSLYQAIILLMFNEQDEVAYAEIKETTRLDDEELKRTLQSLACGKKKVIKKRPAGKDVHDTDIFYYNADFTDPRPKVHINSIQVKVTAEESKKTQSAVEGDRKHYLDAAIVRIMKSKKTMMHQALIFETIDAVKKHFEPDVRMIKERFEQLIDSEYMRRDDEVDNMYVYVA